MLLTFRRRDGPQSQLQSQWLASFVVIRFQALACAVANVQYVDGVRSDGEEDAIAASAAAVEELANFFFEGVVFRREGTTMWEGVEALNGLFEAVEPLDGG